MVSTVPFLVGLLVLGLAYTFPIVLLSRAIQERDNIFLINDGLKINSLT